MWAWIRRNRWFMLVVVGPVLLTTIYYSLIASDQNMSQSRFIVKSATQRNGQISTLANLVQTTSLSSGQEQTSEIMDYIRSRDALAGLDKQADLRKIYGNFAIDRVSRYPVFLHEDAFENLYKFYRDHIDTRFDNDTGLAVLETRAFTPGDAHKINEVLLRLSEQMVNRLNQRAQQHGITEAELRVREAEQRVKGARQRLTEYRNEHELLDPTKQATGVLDIANRLISERLALQAQLALMQREAPKNPQIPAIRSRIAAISNEIANQNGQVVGTQSAISNKISGYDNAALEQEFATQALAAANTALVQARSEADRQQFYLERVVEPDTPDLSLYPQRIKAILTVLAATLCLYFIAWMFVIGILEHSPES